MAAALIFIGIISAGAFAFLIWKLRAAADVPDPRRVALIADRHWPATGRFDVPVVGESFHRDGIRRLVGMHGNEHVMISCIATLALDDRNVHDDKAVAVLVTGVLVGHLSFDDARNFRRRLNAKALTGRATTCEALIRYGGLVNGQRFDYSVSLDIAPFD